MAGATGAPSIGIHVNFTPKPEAGRANWALA